MDGSLRAILVCEHKISSVWYCCETIEDFLAFLMGRGTVIATPVLDDKVILPKVAISHCELKKTPAGSYFKTAPVAP